MKLCACHCEHHVKALGEPVPKPGLPPAYPSYLKPIPINDRDTLRVLSSYIDANIPQVQRILYSTWTAQEEVIKYQEIANAMVGNTLPGHAVLTESWFAAWQESYAAFVNTSLAPIWRKAIEAGGDHIAERLHDHLRGPRDSWQFTPTGKHVDAWIRDHGAQFITRVSEGQQEAVQNIIRYYTTERPVSARELAQMIRPCVGLTESQADAVVKYREKLLPKMIAKEEARLRRPLSDAEREKVTSKAEKKVQQYSQRLHRVRAQRIADTELAFAYNRGEHAAMLQARDDGWFDGGEVVKEWMTSEDEGVCPRCGALDGKEYPMDEEVPGGTEREPSIISPPAHPWCRCAWAYKVKFNGGD